jgi:hypothetical protein
MIFIELASVAHPLGSASFAGSGPRTCACESGSGPGLLPRNIFSNYLTSWKPSQIQPQSVRKYDSRTKTSEDNTELLNLIQQDPDPWPYQSDEVG